MIAYVILLNNKDNFLIISPDDNIENMLKRIPNFLDENKYSDCIICYEAGNDYIFCNTCDNHICINCFHKLKGIVKCPFCRSEYYVNPFK